MGCEACREALSARLDNEDDPGERAAVDTHLAGCAKCQRWFDEAAAVTRLARTGVAVPTLDVTPAVLDAAPGPGRARLALALRVGLGLLGAAQLFLGLVQVSALGAAGAHIHDGTLLSGATPNHLWHESAAWNVAVGAGFLWISARRAGPAGILPTLTAFVAALVLLSVGDIAGGRVEAVRLVSHGFVLAGYLIVLALTRPLFTLGDPPGRRTRATSWWRARFDSDDEAAPSALLLPGLPPESRHIRGLPAGQACLCDMCMSHRHAAREHRRTTRRDAA